MRGSRTRELVGLQSGLSLVPPGGCQELTAGPPCSCRQVGHGVAHVAPLADLGRQQHTTTQKIYDHEHPGPSLDFGPGALQDHLAIYIRTIRCHLGKAFGKVADSG
jgi:hypothetical protein